MAGHELVWEMTIAQLLGVEDGVFSKLLHMSEGYVFAADVEGWHPRCTARATETYLFAS